MTTLKDKIELNKNYGKNRRYNEELYQDVKQADFLFKSELHKLNVKYPDGIPILTLLDVYKRIFGDFEE